MDDFGLVQSACEGSQNAFAEIYDKYSGPVYGFLCNLAGDREEAADILQETFITAGARLHQLKDPRKLRAWLFAIARHQAMHNLRKIRRHDSVEDIQLIDPSPGPAETASQTELAELLDACARGLNPRDQVVLDLHLRRGLEGEELADALGVPLKHANVMVTRLRDQVERALGALLVARVGSRSCPELKTVLAGWDGQLTAIMRKRIARHIDSCADCTALRRKSLSPAALLSAVLLFEVPKRVRKVVLEEVQLVSFRGRPFAGGKDGFPPPFASAGRRRRLPLLGAAALFAALTISFFALAPWQTDTASAPSGIAPSPTGVSEQSTTTTEPAEGDQAQPTSTGDPAGFTSAEPAASTTFAGLVSTSRAPSIVPRVTTSPAIPGPADDRNPFQEPVSTTAPVQQQTSPLSGGQPPIQNTTTTESAPTRNLSASTTAPADLRGPLLGSVRLDPRQIWADGTCGRGKPQTSNVSVEASDLSGVRGVQLEIGRQPSVFQMAAGGGRYTATAGPFGSGLVGPGRSLTIPLTIRATDYAGNTSSLDTELTLSCLAPAQPPTTTTRAAVRN